MKITLDLTRDQFHLIHGILDKECDTYIDMNEYELKHGKKGYQDEINTLNTVLTKIEEVAI